MHTIRLRQVGGSVMFPIPKPLLESLGLSASSSLDLAVENGSLVARPQLRKRYRLEDLLAQCDLDAPRSVESQAWLDDGPVGNEVL